MGLKQTKKLLLKAKKQQNAGNPTGKKKDGPSLQTVVARKLSAQKKRKRVVDGAKAHAGKAKTKTFDVDTANASSMKSSDKKIKGSMSLDDFLAGGFENESSDGASSDDGEEEEEVSMEEPSGNGDMSEESEDEIETHKKDLEQLKEKDPEFYAMLKKEGKELLSFGEDEVSEEEEEEDDEEEEETETKVSNSEQEMTLKRLKEIENQLFQNHSNNALKTWLKLLKESIHYTLSEQDGVTNPKELRKLVQNEKVRDRVITLSITNLHAVFDSKLEIEKPSKNKNWPKMENEIKKSLLSLLALLKQSTDPDMQASLIGSLRSYVKYMMEFPGKIVKNFFRAFVSLWGSTESEKVRLIAFMRIRQMANMSSRVFLVEALKITYLEFVRGAKFSSVRNIEKISMQAKCLVELFGIDLGASYELAFVYIRQLALHLRASIVSRTEENVRGVLSWQYLHCLRIWGSIVAAYSGQPIADNANNTSITADQQQLRPLIYPLIQVVIGTMKLVPSGKYLPMKLHCISILNSLGRSSRNFIPTSQLLLEILLSSEFQERKPMESTAKPPILNDILKLNKQTLRTAPCQQAVVTRVLELMEVHLESIRFSIGLPEIVFPTVAGLKSFCKKTRVGRWRNDVRALVAKIETWSKQVSSQRSSLKFGPSSVKRMDQFLAEDEAIARAQQEAEMFKLNSVEEPEDEALTVENIQNGLKIRTAQQPDKTDVDEVDDDSEEEDSEEEEEIVEMKSKRQKTEETSESEDDVLEEMVMSSDSE